MKQPNALSRAIEQSIRELTAPSSIDSGSLRELAAQAKAVNEEAIAFLSELPPLKSEHHYIALQLIRASFDHGRGLLFLLETNPQDMAGPALALHRSQIENFLRGLFLGFLADAEQVADFLSNDEGIREKDQNGKWQRIGPHRLAVRVEQLINSIANERLDSPNKLSRMVANSWDPLCGFVHGGAAVHAAYMDGQRQIGADISLEVLAEIVGNCYVITNFAFLVVLAQVYRMDGIPTESPLSISMRRFMSLYQRLK
jgi:hypothetical protein